MPYRFALEVGTTSKQDSDDWIQIGSEIENAFFAVDGEQRVYGKMQWNHYRVRLTTPVGVYYSDPVFGLGTLSHRDWRIAREIVRKERLDFKLSAQKGYHLRRRVSGTRCLDCRDFQTGEVRYPDCPSCFGTGFECGYFFPTSCVFFKASPKSQRIELDSGQNRGTVNDVVIQARMINVADMIEDDVIVQTKTDDRYYIHRIQHVAEIRGVPIVGEVELRPIPFSSSIYTIEIPQQMEQLQVLMGG